MGPKPATGRRRATTAPDAQERRADARRNRAAILDAAVACLTSDPDASVGDIARAAGVGRATLYTHFSTRAHLIDAVFTRAVGEADQALAAVDISGDPREALTRLVISTWQIVARFGALLVAAERELPADRIRGHHDRPIRRVRTLIARGQRDGTFRNDVPVSWLVAVFYSLLHTASGEIAAGRLTKRDAPRVIVGTVLAAYIRPT
jgi:AcrR family transcriptional regulator